jgi:hypothetical protein
LQLTATALRQQAFQLLRQFPASHPTSMRHKDNGVEMQETQP